LWCKHCLQYHDEPQLSTTFLTVSHPRFEPYWQWIKAKLYIYIANIFIGSDIPCSISLSWKCFCMCVCSLAVEETELLESLKLTNVLNLNQCTTNRSSRKLHSSSMFQSILCYRVTSEYRRLTKNLVKYRVKKRELRCSFVIAAGVI